MPKHNKTKKYHVVNSNMNRGLKIRLAVSPSQIEREVEIVEQIGSSEVVGVGGVNRGNAENFPIGGEGSGHSFRADNLLRPDDREKIIRREQFRNSIFNLNQNTNNFFSTSNIFQNNSNSTGVGQPVKDGNTTQMSPAVSTSVLSLSSLNSPITSNISPLNSHFPTANTTQHHTTQHCQEPPSSVTSSSFSPETNPVIRELLNRQIPKTISQASQFPAASSVPLKSAPSTFPTPSQSQVLHPHLQNVFQELRGLHYIVHNYNSLSTSFFLLQQRYENLLRERTLLFSQISGCTCKLRK